MYKNARVSYGRCRDKGEEVFCYVWEGDDDCDLEDIAPEGVKGYLIFVPDEQS